ILLKYMSDRGCQAVVVRSIPDALDRLAHDSFNFTVIDLEHESMTAPNILSDLKLQRGDPGTVIALTSDHPRAPSTVGLDRLFGHERGAFTGAHKLKVGKFEAANNGTIFLDEIGDLHRTLQAKLLHVLQDGEFSRVGGRSTLRVDCRVLAATNQDLERGVAEGRFREDLYYRLNVIQIVVPPLRERMAEVPALIDYFVEMYAKMFRRQSYTVPPAI